MADSGLTFDFTQTYSAHDLVPLFDAVISRTAKDPIEVTLTGAATAEQGAQWLANAKAIYAESIGKRSRAILPKLDLVDHVKLILPGAK